jgi:hypothetical protein
MTMDIMAIASVTSQPGVAGNIGRTREALGQEFGKMLFHTLLRGATVSSASGKGRKVMQALPLEMFADQFARQLAVQHQQMFGQLLFNGTMQESQR